MYLRLSCFAFMELSGSFLTPPISAAHDGWVKLSWLMSTSSWCIALCQAILDWIIAEQMLPFRGQAEESFVRSNRMEFSKRCLCLLCLFFTGWCPLASTRSPHFCPRGPGAERAEVQTNDASRTLVWCKQTANKGFLVLVHPEHSADKLPRHYQHKALTRRRRQKHTQILFQVRSAVSFLVPLLTCTKQTNTHLDHGLWGETSCHVLSLHPHQPSAQVVRSTFFSTPFLFHALSHTLLPPFFLISTFLIFHSFQISITRCQPIRLSSHPCVQGFLPSPLHRL